MIKPEHTVWCDSVPPSATLHPEGGSPQGSWPWAVSRVPWTVSHVPGPPSRPFRGHVFPWLRELSSWTRRQWWGHRWGCHSLALTLQLYPAMRAWARTSHLLSRGEELGALFLIRPERTQEKAGLRLSSLTCDLEMLRKGGEKSTGLWNCTPLFSFILISTFKEPKKKKKGILLPYGL